MSIEHRHLAALMVIVSVQITHLSRWNLIFARAPVIRSSRAHVTQYLIDLYISIYSVNIDM